MTALREKPPPHVAWLGYGGLLPFVAGAILVGVDPRHARLWSDALVGYGAVILSFVGALHWGFAMTAAGLAAAERRRAFVWSVMPALLAWSATLLAASPGSLLLVLGFAVHLGQDHRLAGAAQLPTWYLPLRWRLTVVASLGLLAHAWFRMGQG